jgi:L-ribulokinase
MSDLVIGVDYGTDSVRAVITDCSNGEEIASSVFAYPRWARGEFCDPSANRFRQHPLDYIEGIEASIKGALALAPSGTATRVKGISIDTTGSTPCAVDASGKPLALSPEFSSDPDAMFILWKDHSSVAEAQEINEHSRKWPGGDFTRFEGGIYSSEWFWSKILHTCRVSPKVNAAAYSWIEHCDWISAELAGIGTSDAIPRGRCSAGHKALWHESWGGLPPEDYFKALDSKLLPFRRHMPNQTYTADKRIGGLSDAWAKKLGLTPGIAIGAGAFDAHMGAVGVGVQPGWLVRIMGTSTCDIMVADHAVIGDRQVRGICGQVDGSVIPGFVGLEAGQSAFGDLYAWFRDVLLWPWKEKGAANEEIAKSMIPMLEAAASKTPIAEGNPIFVDWLNGRRTPDADQSLKGALLGLSLGTDAPRLFRAIVEGSAFGSKAIVERFADEGIRIEGILGTGGVARKSSFAMQTLADVLGMPIRIAASDQACALGASIFAAVAAGIYPDVRSAQARMASRAEKTYNPIEANAKAYEKLYARYKAAGAFAQSEAGR